MDLEKFILKFFYRLLEISSLFLKVVLSNLRLTDKLKNQLLQSSLQKQLFPCLGMETFMDLLKVSFLSFNRFLGISWKTNQLKNSIARTSCENRL